MLDDGERATRRRGRGRAVLRVRDDGECTPPGRAAAGMCDCGERAPPGGAAGAGRTATGVLDDGKRSHRSLSSSREIPSRRSEPKRVAGTVGSRAASWALGVVASRPSAVTAAGVEMVAVVTRRPPLRCVRQ